MQGVSPARRPARGLRAATLAAGLSLGALLAPAGAIAHVSSQVGNGVLLARSDGAADIIKISCGADLRVRVNGLEPTHGPAPCSAIRRVRVLGGGGPDTINVTRVGPRNGFTNHGLRAPRAVRAFGGPSSDRLSGSRLADQLAGGDGHDVLRGRAGDDLLRGGTGSDRLLGGRGDDRLLGGRGADGLIGGAGKDVERE